MKKHIRLKCSLCKAKHGEPFIVKFPDKQVCQECIVEYQKIFHDFKNRSVRKKETYWSISPNPLLEAFERGWRIAEIENAWPPIAIPESIMRYYDQLWRNERGQWMDPDSTVSVTKNELNWAIERRRQEHSKKMRENGVSEGT